MLLLSDSLPKVEEDYCFDSVRNWFRLFCEWGITKVYSIIIRQHWYKAILCRKRHIVLFFSMFWKKIIDLCWELGNTGTIAVVYFVYYCTADVVGYSFDLNFQVHIIDKKNPKRSWIYELKKSFSCCFSMSISKSLAEAQLVFFTRNYEDLWRPINCNHHVYATPSNNNEKAML